MRTLETPGIVLFTSLGESILFTCENKWNGDCKCFQCLETKLYGCQSWQIKVNIIIYIFWVLSFYKKGPPTLKLSRRCNKSMIFSLHRPSSHQPPHHRGWGKAEESRLKTDATATDLLRLYCPPLTSLFCLIGENWQATIYEKGWPKQRLLGKR